MFNNHRIEDLELQLKQTKDELETLTRLISDCKSFKELGQKAMELRWNKAWEPRTVRR